MGFGVSITITNSRDLSNAMTLLEKRAPGAARKALASAMAIAKRTAVSLAPVDSQLLKRSIKSRAYVRRDKTAVVGELLVRHNKAMVIRRYGRARPADPYYYAHLVELGTKPHAVGKQSQRFKVRPTKQNPSGVPGMQRGGMHPGARPKPFLRPAVENNRAAMEAELERVVDAELERIWRGA